MHLQDSLPPREHDIYGWRTRPTRDIFGESADHQSITQPDDPLTALHREVDADESVSLPAGWKRHLEYMDIIAEVLAPGDKGADLKRFFLEDARSRYWESPPVFPTELGTPSEFRAMCARGEIEIGKHFTRRRQLLTIRLLPIPPDEFEDLDEAGEPAAHWEGRTWIPDTPKDRRTMSPEARERISEAMKTRQGKRKKKAPK